MDPKDQDTIYVGTEAGLYWSQDNGETWERMVSVPAKPVTSLGMDAQGQVLYAAVSGVGIFKGVKR